MLVPQNWAKATGEGISPDGRSIPVTVWGWGENESVARSSGLDRLQRVLERIRRGEPFPERYAYGNQPVREEVLHTIGSPESDQPAAIITRNGYGAEILNVERTLFLDIDLAPGGLVHRFRQMFGGKPAEERALHSLREALRNFGRATFRIYRTAAGFRVMAIDRDFDPAEREAQDLMVSTGTDPAFARLCRIQRSFRARLTPKPWRCGLPVPPGRHPRQEAGVQQRFATWLAGYERVSMGYATCRYLETVGSGSPLGGTAGLVELHDLSTRCSESLPLG